MARIGFALAAACGATATAQTPDAHTIVQAAAESMRSVQTAAYDAKLELRGGRSWRVVTGRVQLARFDYSDPMGGRLAVRGEITRSSSPGGEAFEAAYDGKWIRQLRGGTKVLLRGHPGYGGEELLRGSFGDLILRDILAPEPLVAERGATELGWSTRAEVNGVLCDVVEVRLGDGGRRAEWWFGVEDRLPRKLRRWFRSARGNEVESELILSNLQVDTDIDPGAFQIDAPEGIPVETVGKRPPRQIKIGDPCPDWTLTGSDGKRHKLSDYRGKLVILDFWASWCPYCRRAMPAIQRMHDEYSGRGAVLLALNCRDRGDVDPIAFVRDQGFTYLVADGNEVAVEYRVAGLPSFYLIDRDGRLLHRQSGYNEAKEQQLIKIIERYLDEQGS